jgi:hypothetical protein
MHVHTEDEIPRVISFMVNRITVRRLDFAYIATSWYSEIKRNLHALRLNTDSHELQPSGLPSSTVPTLTHCYRQNEVIGSSQGRTEQRRTKLRPDVHSYILYTIEVDFI